MCVGAPMADRNVRKPDDPENSRDVVELDKDDRWQARLEEARARREIALREKSTKPAKVRRKPWEEDADGTSDDGAIQPVIQDKPEDETGLDFADRLDVMRENVKDSAPDKEQSVAPDAMSEPASEPEVTAKIPPPELNAAPVVAAVPSLAPAPIPKKPKPGEPVKTVAPRIHDYDRMGSPGGAEGGPEELRARARRNAGLVPNDAPDVIDLAQRYAATLKPPNNVTVPFDTSRRGNLAGPQPVVLPKPDTVPQASLRRSRRPFGLSVVVLAFALVPLSQMAPPLEKGPEVPATPFFGLPPALGLTTSLVWLPEPRAEDWIRPVRGPVLGAAQIGEVSGVSILSAIPSLGLADLGGLTGAVDWAPIVPPEKVSETLPLAGVPAQDRPILRVPRVAPRPRPEAPTQEQDTTIETDTNVRSQTVVDLSIEDRSPSALISISPDARPKVARSDVLPPASPLNVTILVPNRTVRQKAEEIAADVAARGHPSSTIREVDINVSTSHVRYFHNDDRTEATRVARDYGVEAKDFTWFRPQPDPGTTEFWLSGGADSNRPRPSRVREPERAEIALPEVPPRTITLVRRRPTFLERLLTGAEDEIEIVVPDPNGIFSGGLTRSVDEN